MSLDWVAASITDDAPCGPDLDGSDDAAFVDYYYDALGRLPEQYIKPGKMNYENGKAVQITPDEVFDPRSIDITTETATITSLLERSRDLRLLTLWAQFQCLAGRLGPLADVIDAIGDAQEVFGSDLHPQGNGTGHRETLAELSSPITMVTALRHMGLVGSGAVTLRLLNVADGKFAHNSTEGEVSGAALRGALSGIENGAAVATTLANINRISGGLDRIKSACLNSETPFTPNLTPTIAILTEIRNEITAARPDLAKDMPLPIQDTAEEPRGEPNESSELPSSPVSPAPLATRPQTAIGSHAEARQALVACEAYFTQNEPSSASLLLVRQARQLIGQPLIVALETLLPDKCGSALVDFGAETGFVIAADRLKSLSDEGLPSSIGDTPSPDEVGGLPTPSNSSEISGVLRSVEEFFLARERSSPVPVLLQRARSYLDKGFQEIVDELIPKPG